MAEAEGFEAIKPEVVVDVALGLLQRESVLASLVWRDAVGDFRGAKDDTISIRLPAYVVANKRALRSADARVRTKLFERKVDVTLTDDLQVDIPITDEEATLDIRVFTRDVMAPGLAAIVRGYEDEVATLMSGASYENEVEIDTSDEQGGYNALVDARKCLNDANVPLADRALVVGSSIEAAILKSPQLARFDGSGSDTALREAQIGRIAGFTVLVSNAIPPDEGYAFHRSAYVLSTRAPFVPQGAAWGASLNEGGYAIRAVQHLETSTDLVDLLALDAWVGTNVVTDVGAIDPETGKFTPAVDPEESGAASLFVRAVKVTLGS